MTVEQALQRFLEGYFSTNHRSEKTRKAYELDLCQLKGFLGPAAGLNSIASLDIERWVHYLKNGKLLKAASIRRKVAAARVFFEYWVRSREIAESPFWRLRLDLKGDRYLPRNLSQVEVTRLIEAAWRPLASTIDSLGRIDSESNFHRIRNIAIVEILFATGMRVGELVNLSLRDWHNDECSFYVKGKGAIHRLAFLTDQRSIRAVRAYIALRGIEGNDPRSFLVTNSGRHLGYQGVFAVLTRLAIDANISRRVTPHMIRHTVATLLLTFGADIRIVQEVLGHSSISTTQRYLHISKEHLRDALSRLHPNHHLHIQCT